MQKGSDKPAVFLAFANAAGEGYLKQLKKESALLRDLFLPWHQRGEIELLREESLDSVELPKLLNAYKGRICIFHFGGHAGQMHLFLEGSAGNAKGLAGLLGLQTGLKLAFLNGCSTQAQARPYLEAGVPAVIATTHSITDEEATLFAEHFYHALLNRHTVREAFQSASGALKAFSSAHEPGVEEAIHYRGVDLQESGLAEAPWRLYVQEDKKHVLEWSLSKPADRGATNKGNVSLKQWIWGWVLAAGVIFSLLASIKELTGFNFQGLFNGRNIDSFSVTVLVHGKGGKDDRILRSQGKAFLDIGATRVEASINEKGEATFKELPIGYLGEKALIGIDHPQPYFPVERGREYTLERGRAIYLEVELKGMDKLRGRVLDHQTEGPLDSVRVSYQNIAVYTDKFGWYELNIPPDKQAKFIRLNFYKDGYQMEDVDSIAPHIQQEAGIYLKRR